MSREDNTFIALSQRASLANNYGADVFVSIHQNSSTASSANGIESYYSVRKTADKPLAQDIQNEMISSTGAKNRGVKSGNFTVINNSKMKATLLETGFISNPTESNKLATASYQDKLATSIANGIENYLKENIKLSNSSSNDNNAPVIKTGYVYNTDSLNVRSGAGTSYSKIGSLKGNEKVEIVQELSGWYKIKYNSGYGYVSKDYIKDTPSNNNDNTETEKVTHTGTVNTDSLNVRSGAGTSYNKIGSLSKGTKVEIVGTTNGWYKIKYNSSYGFISDDYVSNVITVGSGSGSNNGSSSNNGETIIKTGVVYNTDSLNVRSGSSTSYSVIGTLKRNAKVEIVKVEANGWYKIKHGSSYGYISNAYVTNVTNVSNGNDNTQTSKTGYVYNAGTLNVRNGAGTSYTKIGSLSDGNKVEIVGESNGWYKIKYNNGYGYVSKSYISSNPPVNNNTTKTGIVNTASLNVRSGAGTSYSKIGSLSKGTKVEILDEKSGWYKVKLTNGTTGWVSGQYISK